MSITASQCRMARAALNWSIDKLAETSKVGRSTVHRFENGGEARAASLDVIQRAFEAEGIVFIGDGAVSTEGGAGVRVAGEA